MRARHRDERNLPAVDDSIGVMWRCPSSGLKVERAVSEMWNQPTENRMLDQSEGKQVSGPPSDDQVYHLLLVKEIPGEWTGGTPITKSEESASAIYQRVG